MAEQVHSLCNVVDAGSPVGGLQVVPDDGFAQHISHRLAAEKTRSKVGQQCIKSLQAQVTKVVNDDGHLIGWTLRAEVSDGRGGPEMSLTLKP